MPPNYEQPKPPPSVGTVLLVGGLVTAGVVGSLVPLPEEVAVADEKDFEAAGKRILLGLHRQGGHLLTAEAPSSMPPEGSWAPPRELTSLRARSAWPTRELDALPEDPRRRATSVKSAPSIAQLPARVQEADRNLAQMGMPSAMPTGIAASELAELAALARQREMREAQQSRAGRLGRRRCPVGS